ncbi:hypothetical protein [Chryseobacterium tongliaoense]|uniref:hypothetical protein n=1 Tax=Chryseobacterium tongliaoense TaxID=3240933 RepID=UPI0035159B0F
MAFTKQFDTNGTLQLNQTIYVSHEIKIKLAKLKLSAGITIDYGGDIKNQTDSFTSLGNELWKKHQYSHETGSINSYYLAVLHR